MLKFRFCPSSGFVKSIFLCVFYGAILCHSEVPDSPRYTRDDYPIMASIRDSTGHFCSGMVEGMQGTITISTALNCVEHRKPEELEIRLEPPVGGQTRFRVDKIHYRHTARLPMYQAQLLLHVDHEIQKHLNPMLKTYVAPVSCTGEQPEKFVLTRYLDEPDQAPRVDKFQVIRVDPEFCGLDADMRGKHLFCIQFDSSKADCSKLSGAMLFNLDSTVVAQVPKTQKCAQKFKDVSYLKVRSYHGCWVPRY